MLSDCFVKLPKGNSLNYIKSVIKYVKKFKINFIIPCSDEEAITLSNNLNKFKNLYKYCMSNSKVNKVICNKIVLISLVVKNNISVPLFKVASQNLT